MFNFIGLLSGTDFICAGLALLLVLIISLSLHEFGHAYIAYKQGDITPKAQGRVSLNPLVHIDPIGFICCAIFGFGWAKPVEINPLHFRRYRKGMVLTSIAGVVINLVLAFIGCGLYYLTVRFISDTIIWKFFNFFTYFLFNINICLFIFNLLPIYPLDGFKVVSALTKYGNKYVDFMYKYGNIILILLLIFGDVLLFKLVTWVSMPLEMLWSWIIL